MLLLPDESPQVLLLHAGVDGKWIPAGEVGGTVVPLFWRGSFVAVVFLNQDHLSNEKKTWLVRLYSGFQLYRDYSKPL